MPNVIAIALLTTIGLTAAYAAPSQEKHFVSPLVSQVTVGRVNDVIFRYVQFFEQYPCLRLETFADTNFKRIDKIEACKFTVDGKVIDVAREKLSGVLYENFKLEGNVFSFSTDIIFATPGHRYLNCSVSIAKTGKMSPLACKPGERPREPDGK